MSSAQRAAFTDALHWSNSDIGRERVRVIQEINPKDWHLITKTQIDDESYRRISKHKPQVVTPKGVGAAAKPFVSRNPTPTTAGKDAVTRGKHIASGVKNAGKAVASIGTAKTVFKATEHLDDATRQPFPGSRTAFAKNLKPALWKGSKFLAKSGVVGMASAVMLPGDYWDHVGSGVAFDIMGSISKIKFGGGAKNYLVGGLIGSAAYRGISAIAGAFSAKDDDWNIIEGLPHGGKGEETRRELTEFGSGYTGKYQQELNNVSFGIDYQAKSVHDDSYKDFGSAEAISLARSMHGIKPHQSVAKIMDPLYKQRNIARIQTKSQAIAQSKDIINDQWQKNPTLNKYAQDVLKNLAGAGAALGSHRSPMGMFKKDIIAPARASDVDMYHDRMVQGTPRKKGIINYLLNKREGFGGTEKEEKKALDIGIETHEMFEIYHGKRTPTRHMSFGTHVSEEVIEDEAFLNYSMGEDQFSIMEGFRKYLEKSNLPKFRTSEKEMRKTKAESEKWHKYFLEYQFDYNRLLRKQRREGLSLVEKYKIRKLYSKLVGAYTMQEEYRLKYYRQRTTEIYEKTPELAEKQLEELGLPRLNLPFNAFSGKDDAWNSIEGLKHGGMAEGVRKGLTDFGSGYIGQKKKKKKDEWSGSPEVQEEFQFFRESMHKYGVLSGTGHKRILIPKSVFTIEDMEELGFQAVKIAIPESGQTSFRSFRHVKNNYHIHEFEDAWSMHEDRHSSMTMALRRNQSKKVDKQQENTRTGEFGTKAKIVAGGLSHVFSEGVPGGYYWIRGQIAGTPDMDERLKRELPEEYKQKLAQRFDNTEKMWERDPYPLKPSKVPYAMTATAGTGVLGGYAFKRGLRKSAYALWGATALMGSLATGALRSRFSLEKQYAASEAQREAEDRRNRTGGTGLLTALAIGGATYGLMKGMPRISAFFKSKFSGNHRAYNTVEGMGHGGFAERIRRAFTVFGSSAIAEKLVKFTSPVADKMILKLASMTKGGGVRTKYLEQIAKADDLVVIKAKELIKKPALLHLTEGKASSFVWFNDAAGPHGKVENVISLDTPQQEAVISNWLYPDKMLPLVERTIGRIGTLSHEILEGLHRKNYRGVKFGTHQSPQMIKDDLAMNWAFGKKHWEENVHLRTKEALGYAYSGLETTRTHVAKWRLVLMERRKLQQEALKKLDDAVSASFGAPDEPSIIAALKTAQAEVVDINKQFFKAQKTYSKVRYAQRVGQMIQDTPAQAKKWLGEMGIERGTLREIRSNKDPNIIEGMRHGGFAEKIRKLFTPFGSTVNALRVVNFAEDVVTGIVKHAASRNAPVDIALFYRIAKKNKILVSLPQLQGEVRAHSQTNYNPIYGYRDNPRIKITEGDVPDMMTSLERLYPKGFGTQEILRERISNISHELFEGLFARKIPAEGRKLEEELIEPFGTHHSPQIIKAEAMFSWILGDKHFKQAIAMREREARNALGWDADFNLNEDLRPLVAEHRWDRTLAKQSLVETEKGLDEVYEAMSGRISTAADRKRYKLLRDQQLRPLEQQAEALKEKIEKINSFYDDLRYVQRVGQMYRDAPAQGQKILANLGLDRGQLRAIDTNKAANIIEGMRHGGMSEKIRSFLTPFSSPTVAEIARNFASRVFGRPQNIKTLYHGAGPKATASIRQAGLLSNRAAGKDTLSGFLGETGQVKADKLKNLVYLTGSRKQAIGYALTSSFIEGGVTPNLALMLASDLISRKTKFFGNKEVRKAARAARREYRERTKGVTAFSIPTGNTSFSSALRPNPEIADYPTSKDYLKFHKEEGFLGLLDLEEGLSGMFLRMQGKAELKSVYSKLKGSYVYERDIGPEFLKEIRTNKDPNIIEGMRHGGFAEKIRKLFTPFGSTVKGMKAANQAMKLYRGIRRADPVHIPRWTDSLDEKTLGWEKYLEKVRLEKFPDRPSRFKSTFWSPEKNTAEEYAAKSAMFSEDTTGYVSSITRSSEDVFFTSPNLWAEGRAEFRLGGKSEYVNKMAERYWKGTTIEEWNQVLPFADDPGNIEALIPGRTVAEEVTPFFQKALFSKTPPGRITPAKASAPEGVPDEARRALDELMEMDNPFGTSAPPIEIRTNRIGNIIEGMRHGGFAEKIRKFFTIFGSGSIGAKLLGFFGKMGSGIIRPFTKARNFFQKTKGIPFYAKREAYKAGNVIPIPEILKPLWGGSTAFTVKGGVKKTEELIRHRIDKLYSGTPKFDTATKAYEDLLTRQKMLGVENPIYMNFDTIGQQAKLIGKAIRTPFSKSRKFKATLAHEKIHNLADSNKEWVKVLEKHAEQGNIDPEWARKYGAMRKDAGLPELNQFRMMDEYVAHAAGQNVLATGIGPAAGEFRAIAGMKPGFSAFELQTERYDMAQKILAELQQTTSQKVAGVVRPEATMSRMSKKAKQSFRALSKNSVGLCSRLSKAATKGHSKYNTTLPSYEQIVNGPRLPLPPIKGRRIKGRR